jgi:hypothetical protein
MSPPDRERTLERGVSMAGIVIAIVVTADTTPARVPVLVLRAGATGEDTVTEIEMTTDAGILADLLRKEETTILEDIDTHIIKIHLFTGQPHPTAYPIEGCKGHFYFVLPLLAYSETSLGILHAPPWDTAPPVILHPT